MNTLLDLTAPLIVTAACVLALCKGVDIFAAMTDGAKKGLRVMADILPALLVLFPVIYLLRASGLPELLERLLAPVFKALGIPVETSLLMLLRPVSGSTALSVSAELIARYGADSLVGRTAARAKRRCMSSRCISRPPVSRTAAGRSPRRCAPISRASCPRRGYAEFSGAENYVLKNE